MKNLFSNLETAKNVAASEKLAVFGLFEPGRLARGYPAEWEARGFLVGKAKDMPQKDTMCLYFDHYKD
jgi:hypothetical protein